MKKIKKAIIIVFLSLFGVTLITLFSAFGYYFLVTHSVSLDESKLENLEQTSLEIIDIDGEKISPTSEVNIEVNSLSSRTKNAFICAEDKRFYSHNGIDLIRIAGALKSNIKSHSFSQGASTISQQLIKNTHLSNEKTIKRKLKEIKLTRQLEKKYSKDQILEMYLNNIYFGNGCYGIENAAKHYFGKSASELTLAESALLAGTINAPAVYDPQKKMDKANERKNLILGLMKSQGKIDESEYEDAKNEEVKLNLTNSLGNNYIYNEILKEACKILKMNENELKNSKIKIQTYFNKKLDEEIEQKINQNYNLGKDINVSVLVVENSSGGVISAIGARGLESNHQPGSTIKPILVYAPALEKNIISPATKILDEKVNFNGYCPENADKKYHGYVSVRDALKNSYNIPAVKLFNEVGISDGEQIASKMGITFSEQDKNLAVALGGFTNGISLSSLLDSYTCLANNGKYKKSQFISKIYKNNSEIYSNSQNFVQAIKDITSYLLTDMLLDTAKTGTARRLKELNFQVASKTGTVGEPNSNKNSDAFNVSYTTSHSVLVYFGGENMPEKINGATYPTLLAKDIYNLLYNGTIPKDFEPPNGIVKKSISKADYEKNILSLSSDPSDSITEIFSKSNLPSIKRFNQNNKINVFNFENKKPIISFIVSPQISYKIIRKNEASEIILASEQNMENKPKIIKFEDLSAKRDDIYEYCVEFFDPLSNKADRSNSIKLKSF